MSSISVIHRNLKAAAYTAAGVDVVKLFHSLDSTNSGSLSFDEFRSAVRRRCKVGAGQVSDDDLQHVFRDVDVNGTGRVDVQEFCEWFDAMNEQLRAMDQHRGGASTHAAAAGGGRRGSVDSGRQRRPSTGSHPSAEGRPATSTGGGGGSHQRSHSSGLVRNPRPPTARRSESPQRASVPAVAPSSTSFSQVAVGALSPSKRRKQRRNSTLKVDGRRLNSLRNALLGAALQATGRRGGRKAAVRALGSLFEEYDVNRSGALSLPEFTAAIRNGVRVDASRLSDSALVRLFCMADADASGTVQLDEFLAWVQADGGGEAAQGANGESSRDSHKPAPPPHRRARSQPRAHGDTVSSRSHQKAAVGDGGQDDEGEHPIALALRMQPGALRTLKQKLRAAAYAVGGVDFAKLFRHYDRDNSGMLKFEEFRSALRRDGKIDPKMMSDAELMRMFCLVDVDAGGLIDRHEFSAWLQDSNQGARRDDGDAGGDGGAAAAASTVAADPDDTRHEPSADEPKSRTTHSRSARNRRRGSRGKAATKDVPAQQSPVPPDHWAHPAHAETSQRGDAVAYMEAARMFNMQPGDVIGESLLALLQRSQRELADGDTDVLLPGTDGPMTRRVAALIAGEQRATAGKTGSQPHTSASASDTGAVGSSGGFGGSDVSGSSGDDGNTADDGYTSGGHDSDSSNHGDHTSAYVAAARIAHALLPPSHAAHLTAAVACACHCTLWFCTHQWQCSASIDSWYGSR